MKLITLVPAVFALSAGVLFAQDTAPSAEHGSSEHPDFAAADTDKDGLLSISELQAALPDVQITDSNADGFVNQSEAEEAISGLAFETNGYTGGSSLVSEPEYGLLVSTLEDEAGPGASDAGDSGESAGVSDGSVN
ncbi:MAG TPA: hypothetical protein VGE69_07130 [Pseudomonadales bacterium]